MKNLKKIVASVSVTALGVAALAGCTRAPKASSMFDVMKNASELDKYSYEISCSYEMEGESFDLTIFGECDGKAASVSFKADVDGVKYEVEDALIATDSALYVNIKSVSALAGAADFDLSAYGITGDWVSIDFGEAAVAETDMDSALFLDALDKAYDDVIEEKDGKYEIRISSDEDLQKFIDATIVLLNDNGEEWSEEIADVYNQFDYETIVRDMITDIFTDVNKQLDAGMTDSEIDEIINEAMADTDFSEFEIDASECEEMLAELADGLEESKEDITFEDSGLDKITITTSQKDNDYIFKAQMVGMSDGQQCSFVVSTTITKDASVSVSVPDKNVQSVSEVICALLNEFGVTADNIDEYLEGVEDMSGSLYNDYDYDYDYDDEYDY